MDKHKISDETDFLAPDEERLQGLDTDDPILACAGDIIGRSLGEFRRTSVIAIAEFGPFDQNQIDEIFAKIAVGMVFSGHFDPRTLPEDSMVRRADAARKIAGRMQIASELIRSGRIHEIDDASTDQARGQALAGERPNIESSRGAEPLASERPNKEGAADAG